MSDNIDLKAILAQFHEDLLTIKELQALELLKKAYLGKNSQIKMAFKVLKDLPPEEKKTFAASIQGVSTAIEKSINDIAVRIERDTLDQKLESEWIDLTLPGVAHDRGMLHPITQVEQRCMEVLRQLGFALEEGDEVETAFYNFDALNIPDHHPARDEQDTFWLKNQLLLRSHTTAVQARILESHQALPIKVASAGRVYRNEAVDATHVAMFHQFEGFWLDKDITFADLKGVVSFVAQELYGKDRPIRFKPKFYPYTEPSIGLDVQCGVCSGKGCGACHDTGWVTIIGAGMIHRDVLLRFDYDPDKVQGIAFGWGVTRMAAQLFNVKKIKQFYEQDMRFYQALNGGGV